MQIWMQLQNNFSLIVRRRNYWGIYNDSTAVFEWHPRENLGSECIKLIFFFSQMTLFEAVKNSPLWPLIISCPWQGPKCKFRKSKYFRKNKSKVMAFYAFKTVISKLYSFGLNEKAELFFGVWNSNDFLTRILYKFRITFWIILYNLPLLIYFSLQFLKLDFISLQTQFLYNFWKLFSLSLQFLKLAFISLQFLKLTFISLQFLFLYNSDATHFQDYNLEKLRLQVADIRWIDS